MNCASMRALPGGAANVRFGRSYQVLVRGHRPRALGTPVHKLFRSRQYIPPYLALRIIVVLCVHVKDIGSCRDS
jgi:hypothetical protein